MTRHAILLTLSAVLVQAPADFEVVDQAAFQKLFPKGAAVRKLAGDMKFIEGPVWVAEPGGGYFVFSDIPANELKRWDAKSGVRTFRAPSGSANGNTLDREGRLLTAEHAGTDLADRKRRHGHDRRRFVRRQEAQLTERRGRRA